MYRGYVEAVEKIVHETIDNAIAIHRNYVHAKLLGLKRELELEQRDFNLPDNNGLLCGDTGLTLDQYTGYGQGCSDGIQAALDGIQKILEELNEPGN